VQLEEQAFELVLALELVQLEEQAIGLALGIEQ